MTERGREVLEMAKRKLAVNDLIGENTIDFDDDDARRILGANPNIPG